MKVQQILDFLKILRKPAAIMVIARSGLAAPLGKRNRHTGSPGQRRKQPAVLSPTHGTSDGCGKGKCPKHNQSVSQGLLPWVIPASSK